MKVTHPTRGAFSRSTLSLAVAGVLMSSMTQTAVAQSEPMMEEVTVVGIRASLERAMDIKREASGVVDSISAEDLGKFPDLNVAESLQRITGVAIDRSGGEGQQVTVRGLGPQFNMVTVNGRQLANDSDGREFNFDVISADQIKGADVFKSTNATYQDGGIGATINLSTARPFDKPGLSVVGSVKGMYETLSEEIAPSASFMVSNTFMDDKVGVLLAYSHQERDVQINRIETAGWRPNQTISYKDSSGDTQVLHENAYIPRNWDQIVDEQERTRDNLSAVLQFAPSDDVTITLDGFKSTFEVDSVVTDLASWFEPDRVTEATIADNGTLTSFNQQIGAAVSSGDPASDFVSHTRNGRDVTTNGFGLNVEWAITDKLVADFDYSTSSAEDDRAGQDRFNVVGIINNYEFDGTGSIPVVRHDGFTGDSLPAANLARLHYNEKGNTRSNEDEITETKLDFEYSLDGGVLESVRFGVYNQERQKDSFQIFASQCEFCGYGTAAPLDVIGFQEYQADNFFPGLIDRFYTYDGDAYVQYLADQGFPISPTLQPNRYTVEESIQAAYVDLTMSVDLGGKPLTVNFGSRYSETEVDSLGVQSTIVDVTPTTDQTLFQNILGTEADIGIDNSYSALISSLNTKFELTEDMVIRFAAYESITRPTLSDMSPSTTFNEPRRQNLTAQGGNPNLDPFEAMNYDLSFEWYYGDASSMSIAYFQKDIDNFIVTLTGEEVFEMTNRSAADGFRCNDASRDDLCRPDSTYNTGADGDLVASTEELNGASEVYTVSRPRNGQSASIDGTEIAITHVFDFGLGISANATFVDSSATLGADTTETFALEGLGDSQNIVVFYEQDNYQARIAYNNREGFLRRIDNGFNGEPVNTDSFGQWDISGSYDLNENVTLFFEGINITKEELRQTGRFANQTYNIEDNGSRYAVGVRASF